jgi:hypothetical protein
VWLIAVSSNSANAGDNYISRAYSVTCVITLSWRGLDRCGSAKTTQDLPIAIFPPWRHGIDANSYGIGISNGEPALCTAEQSFVRPDKRPDMFRYHGIAFNAYFIGYLKRLSHARYQIKWTEILVVLIIFRHRARS